MAACKKDKDSCDIRPVTAGDGASVVGTWELYQSGGGFSGQTITYPNCNGDRYAFAADLTYKRYSTWKLVKQGSYEIVADVMRTRGNIPGNRIIFDRDTVKREFIAVKEGKLSIEADFIDAGGSSYIRRNPDREK